MNEQTLDALTSVLVPFLSVFAALVAVVGALVGGLILTVKKVFAINHEQREHADRQMEQRDKNAETHEKAVEQLIAVTRNALDQLTEGQKTTAQAVASFRDFQIEQRAVHEEERGTHRDILDRLDVISRAQQSSAQSQERTATILDRLYQMIVTQNGADGTATSGV